MHYFKIFENLYLQLKKAAVNLKHRLILGSEKKWLFLQTLTFGGTSLHSGVFVFAKKNKIYSENIKRPA